MRSFHVGENRISNDVKTDSRGNDNYCVFQTTCAETVLYLLLTSRLPGKIGVKMADDFYYKKFDQATRSKIHPKPPRKNIIFALFF